MSEHKVPVSTYLVVFACLLVLTALTVYAAEQDLGRLNAAVALTIATTKASLVVLFFMHVKYSSRLTQLFVVAGIIWLGILIFITMSDFLSRTWPIV